MIRVVLAEDHTLVREGIRTMLGLVPDIELAGEAADGEEAIRVVLSAKPDVLLLDMRMPKADGLRVIGRLAAKGALPATLVLTTFDDDQAAIDVVAAGARGFILKDVTLAGLVDAVRTVAAGGTAVRSELLESMDARRRGPGEITAREREVLRLLAAGCSNREIARALFVAEGTVKNYVSKIFDKMGVRNRAQAARKALERGYA